MVGHNKLASPSAEVFGAPPMTALLHRSVVVWFNPDAHISHYLRISGNREHMSAEKAVERSYSKQLPFEHLSTLETLI